MPYLKSDWSGQRGTAIIVALFVMSIVAIASVAMISRLNIDLNRTTLILNADKAYLYAEGSIAWAKDQLVLHITQQRKNQLVDKLPLESRMDKQDGFVIQSTIYDAQSFFNVNNLTSTEYQQDFIQLLKAVEPALAGATQKRIMKALQDWVSPASDTSTLAALYAKNKPPYSAPHRLMASASEIRLLDGMSADLYTKLYPFIIALPEVTAINVNTAMAPVLMSLSPTLTPAAANSIILQRREVAFSDPKQFMNLDIIKNNPIPAAKISVLSNYFLVKTSVKVADQEVLLYTLLKRLANNSKATIIVLWQTKGPL